MNIHQYIQTLRLHLLDMARVCQRGVDYSIKAYNLGRPESCTNARDDAYEMNILYREIIEITRDLMLIEISKEPDLRFVLSAERICKALQTIHLHAVDIAANSMRLLECSRRMECKELVSMGNVVNALMRLCVVALFEEGVEQAETVLRSEGVEREFESKIFDWFRILDRRERTQAGYEIAISRSLSRMARELHEIAKGIVFWLNDSPHKWSPQNMVLHTFRVQKRKEDLLEATPLSDGKESFLQTIDTCFADACFWNRL